MDRLEAVTIGDEAGAGRARVCVGASAFLGAWSFSFASAGTGVVQGSSWSSSPTSDVTPPTRERGERGRPTVAGVGVAEVREGKEEGSGLGRIWGCRVGRGGG